MPAKTVALDDDAYQLPRRARGPGESLSDAIQRVLRQHSVVLDLAGGLGEPTAKEWEAIARERAIQRQLDLERQVRFPWSSRP